MNDIESLENAKKAIDELKIKNIAHINEKKRLEEELDKIKKEIKEIYDVEIEDFNSAIETMKKEQEILLNKLNNLIKEATEKLGVKNE